MLYYSTNGKAPLATLEKAVVKGLAEDRGLYMPQQLKRMPDGVFDSIQDMDFHEIACCVADSFFGEDVPQDILHGIVRDTLSFDCPVVKVTDRIRSLELFHGPTLAFKDVGARFMARMLRHFNGSSAGETVNVLVATSGDTGSAVANGFLGVDGIRVFVLYPKGKVSPIQECQFTTLGRNINALEIDGNFDDCQALVKNAFMDAELNAGMKLTSANSINVARFLPQSFYYFHAYAQMKKLGLADELVVCVPSGNFGNICSALFAWKAGLPVKRFIAANNANDVFFKYLQTGKYEPKPSVQTIANAMDVGAPSNFDRILDLFGGDWKAISGLINGFVSSDDEIRATMAECLKENGYTLDPHGACAYRALKAGLGPGETGVFCETAHPAKFKQVVDAATGTPVAIPDRLAAFMEGKVSKTCLGKDYGGFKDYLTNLK